MNEEQLAQFSSAKCADCSWERRALHDSRHALMLAGFAHITETDGHRVQMLPPMGEGERPAPDFLIAAWNGEPCLAQRVVVQVPEWDKDDAPAAWWRAAGSTSRLAVVVFYAGTRFVLDDEDGAGWRKLTVGRGSPRFGHRSLPDRARVLRAAA